MATRKKKPHWDSARLADLESGKVHVVKVTEAKVMTTASTGLVFSPRPTTPDKEKPPTP